MNKGFLVVGIILLALVALNLLAVLNGYATGSELDYYLLKETTDAALQDALDPMYLRTCGLYRLDKERFAESFVKRFAASVDATRSYHIGFYDINEVPPRVSVKIESLTFMGFKTGLNSDADVETPTILTSYDAVLETRNYYDTETENDLKDPHSDLCKSLKELVKADSD